MFTAFIGSTAFSAFPFQQRIIGRIEVIVKVDSVHIIVFHNFCNGIGDILFYFFFCRVVTHGIVIGQNPVRMLSCHIICGKDGQIHAGSSNTIRIHPSMKFHTTFMGFLNHKFHRIITGVFALCSSQNGTPGVQIGFVKGIPFGTNLYHNSI